MPCRSWSLQAIETCPASKDSESALAPAQSSRSPVRTMVHTPMVQISQVSSTGSITELERQYLGRHNKWACVWSEVRDAAEFSATYEWKREIVRAMARLFELGMAKTMLHSEVLSEPCLKTTALMMTLTLLDFSVSTGTTGRNGIFTYLQAQLSSSQISPVELPLRTSQPAHPQNHTPQEYVMLSAARSATSSPPSYSSHH